MFNEDEKYTQNLNRQISFYQGLDDNKQFNFTPSRISGAMMQWGTKHDLLLSKLVVEMKYDWKRIAKQFNKKWITPRFVRDRYRAITEPLLPKKTRFTHDEDLQIVKYYTQYGSNWKAITNFLPGRTSTMIKNRFYSSIKKKNLIPSMLMELSKRAENENWEEVLLEMDHCLNLEEDERRQKEWQPQRIIDQEEIFYNQPELDDEKIKEKQENLLKNLCECPPTNNVLPDIEHELDNRLQEKIFSLKKEDLSTIQEEQPFSLDTNYFPSFQMNNMPAQNEGNPVLNTFDDDTFKFLNSNNSFDQFAFYDFEDKSAQKPFMEPQFTFDDQNDVFAFNQQSSLLSFQSYIEDLNSRNIKESPLKNTIEFEMPQTPVKVQQDDSIQVKDEAECEQALVFLNDKIASLMTLYKDTKVELSRFQDGKRLQ